MTQTLINFDQKTSSRRDVPTGRCVRRDDGWWVTGFTGNPEDDCGPYEVRTSDDPTKDSADEDRKGLYRFWKSNLDLFKEACNGK